MIDHFFSEISEFQSLLLTLTNPGNEVRNEAEEIFSLMKSTNLFGTISILLQTLLSCLLNCSSFKIK